MKCKWIQSRTFLYTSEFVFAALLDYKRGLGRCRHRQLPLLHGSQYEFLQYYENLEIRIKSW